MQIPALLGRSVVLRWLWRLGFRRLTRAGRWFVVPSLLFLAWSTFSFRGQVFLPAAYAISIWAIAIAGSVLRRPRVRLRLRLADRGCAGETLPIEAEIESTRAGVAPDLHLRALPLPAGLAVEPSEGAGIPPLSPGTSATARLGVVCAARGAYTLPGFEVVTDFPLGLWCTASAASPPRRLLVYPRFAPLARIALPTGRRYQPGGVALASVVGESAEYVGNREYRDGDNVRDIDWRATARLQRPIVREYRQEYFLRVAVVLDTRVAPGAPPRRREEFERAVSAAAAVGDALARQEYIVDLFAAGPDLYHLTAGRSLAYLDQILDILACVESCTEEPFGTIEPELVENLARISTVVCVLLDWDEARRAFVDLLRRHGVGLKILIVRSGACTLDPAADLAGTDVTRFDPTAGPPPTEL